MNKTKFIIPLFVFVVAVLVAATSTSIRRIAMKRVGTDHK